MTNKENRVLSRRGARVVTMEEANTIQGGGGPSTKTLCTFDPKAGPDGDVTLGECH